MIEVREYNTIEPLTEFRRTWSRLLAQTPGASFFHTLEWLEAYWRHFGDGQRLRVLAGFRGSDPVGFMPLVVRREKTRVGSLRVLGYPLHDWGSFYGPIGAAQEELLAAGMQHVLRSPRDWDIVELRWAGAPGTDPETTGRAMREAGMQALRTLWDRTALVDLDGTWDAYFAARPRAWRRKLRAARRKLEGRVAARLVRFRPAGNGDPSDDPRWDLYDACEDVAARSWQADVSNGTTLTHAGVRAFLRDAHAAAVPLGAVDLNLLLIDDAPAAFIYSYVWRGSVSGLRLGYDSARSRDGAGTLLMAESIRDSFARGDRWYDLGVGSLESKRHLLTAVAPVFRFSHYHPGVLRTQVLRAKRWTEARALGRKVPSIAVGRVQDSAADAR